MKVVVDTSILVDHLRGGDQWVDFIQKAERTASLCLPTIVIYELCAGKSAETLMVQEKIYELTRRLQKVDLTEEIAREAGRLYRSVTSNLEAPDYIIAASALTLGASVLTLNRKHFRQVPGLVIAS